MAITGSPSQRTTCVDKDADDAEQFDAEKTEHGNGWTSIDADADASCHDTQGHSRKEELVVGGPTVNLGAISQGEESETKFDRSKESVLAQHIGGTVRRKPVNRLVKENGEVDSRADNAPGSGQDEGHYIRVEE